MTSTKRSITLTPSWKAFFWQYALGILLTPVLIGIYILWRTRKTHASIRYKISDQKITVVDGHISQNIDLVDIRKAISGETQFGVGPVTIRTSGREIELVGLENPAQIARSIEKAVEAELKRLEAQKQTKPRETKYGPGEMDRLDYLTGLWQQGLISNEDFDKEQQKFKKD
ncbi:hypothetical protein [Rhodohalobacter sp.]|uniref:hypothetical protein n=1 Tax=Rhodohalobacter sp. TaxID=1974210 RepID=UPI002ACE23AC|nr:hypothetical protein [Rhodohalobacter sp.]MDZ7756130.1 hypothetical protein [Rhodohalobacter sp.]